MRRTRLPVLALSMLTVVTTASAQDALSDNNPILKRLVDEGVTSPAGAMAKLPEFTLVDGLDAAGQRAAMEKIASRTHPLDALLRKSVVAPFVLKIADAEQGSTIRRVDLWFVVYGELDRITNEDFLKEQADNNKNGGPESKAVFLSPEELSSRGIQLSKADGSDERYAHTRFPLFDRVYISATGHGIETRNEESVVVASVLDERFAEDADFPNQWSPLTRTPAGKLQVGKPNPYAGSGSYVKATMLRQPAGAIFVEYHIVFDEPQGWFNGENLLLSKLPILVQDEVRKFRRRLADGK